MVSKSCAAGGGADQLLSSSKFALLLLQILLSSSSKLQAFPRFKPGPETPTEQGKQLLKPRSQWILNHCGYDTFEGAAEIENQDFYKCTIKSNKLKPVGQNLYQSMLKINFERHHAWDEIYSN